MDDDVLATGLSIPSRVELAPCETDLHVEARDGIRNSELRQQSKIRDAVAWAKLSKIRWAGHVMRFRDDRWTRAVVNFFSR
ncbi:hypothetical protein Q1695_005418 [Nippostrongylus brasiliensis]|nr:hypothetical protein Q1695_005418 [Nippostrongylus brasiliensis]